MAAINTIQSVMGINLDTLRPEPSVEGYSTPGGYSCKAVKPIALAKARHLCRNQPGHGKVILHDRGYSNNALRMSQLRSTCTSLSLPHDKSVWEVILLHIPLLCRNNLRVLCALCSAAQEAMMPTFHGVVSIIRHPRVQGLQASCADTAGDEHQPDDAVGVRARPQPERHRRRGDGARCRRVPPARRTDGAGVPGLSLGLGLGLCSGLGLCPRSGTV